MTYLQSLLLSHGLALAACAAQFICAALHAYFQMTGKESWSQFWERCWLFTLGVACAMLISLLATH